MLEVAADESMLDTTAGHTSEGESVKESDAESDDGSYETVESTAEGERAPVAEHQVSSWPVFVLDSVLLATIDTLREGKISYELCCDS